MRLHLHIFCFFIAIFLNKCDTAKKEKQHKAENRIEYTFSKPSADGIGKFYLHREISQVMEAGGASWLEREERQEEENVRLAIAKMNLSSGDIVADIGAGTGYYSFKIAEKVPRGKVYAVEIQDEFIRYLKNRKEELNNKNVEITKGTIRSPGLPENSIDLAIMADVYHELEYPHEMLQSIRKSLKAGGKLLLIEYRGEDSSLAIKALHKTTVVQLNREMEANGYKLFYDGEFLPIQHFLLYEKK